MDNKFIEMKSIVKIFPPNVVAIDGANVDIERGEIHSIIGENGAGKSTLMKVLYGLEKQNFGEIFVNGEKVEINTPNDAVRLGIGMVHQEFMLVGEFSVLENVVLGVEPKKGPFIDTSSSRKDVAEILDLLKLSIDLDEKIKNISIAAQQKVEIVKQLYRQVDVLILDEPTAVLTPQETDELFRLLEDLRQKGKTILFISHKLDEVLQISDRITVMRKGQLVWTKENKELTKTDLANAMVGRSVLFTVDKEKIEQGKPVLEVENLNLTDEFTSRQLLKNINFTVHEGEILGLAGVEGNGQMELVDSITQNSPATGKISVYGQDIGSLDVHERRYHLSYVPQDRKIKGSSQDSSLTKNLFMSHHYLTPGFVGKWGLLNRKKISDFSRNLLKKYQVNTENPRVPMGALSGGNQQKIILAREFELGKNLLIVDQPVRGLDIGSIEYVHQQILDKRAESKACLLISADLDELFKLSDRIIVIYRGEIIADKLTEDTNKEEIGNYMLGAIS